jgi:hypothetical protein
MSSGPGRDANGDYTEGSCHCLTEQGTRYNLPPAQCRNLVALGGVYNPFKAPERDRQLALQGALAPRAVGPSMGAPAPAVAPAASSVDYGDHADYGGIGIP